MSDDDRSLSSYLGIGAAAAAAIVACGGIGLVIDEAAGTLPIFVFVGLIIGIAAAVLFVRSQFRDSLRGPSER